MVIYFVDMNKGSETKVPGFKNIWSIVVKVIFNCPTVDFQNHWEHLGDVAANAYRKISRFG